MSVSQQDRDAMKRILGALNGDLTYEEPLNLHESQTSQVELAGLGQVTQKDITAMADVLKKLNNVTAQVVTESKFNPQLAEAVNTSKVEDGVKVGNYQIMIKEDAKRMAGKQYYSIYHSQTHDVIADDITLYETALSVVKLLNSGKFANSPIVRKLFEADDRYTANKTDAMRFKSLSKSAQNKMDFNKSDLYESRYQSSVNNAMAAKRDIKKIIEESRRGK